MAKFDKMIDVNGFDGIRDAVKIGEFDQYDLSAQRFDNSADLTFGEVRRRNVL